MTAIWYTPLQTESLEEDPSMTRIRIVFAAATLCGLTFDLAVMAQPAGVTGYEVTSLGVAPGQTTSNVQGIDDFARVVGKSGSLFSTPFVWINGEMIVIPAPEGYQRPMVNGIGDGGVVTGRATLLESSVFHPIVWTAQSGTHVLDLLPGMTRGSAHSPDNQPWPLTQIGGYCNSGSDYATMWRGTEAMQMGGPRSSLGPINALGHAVGVAQNQQGVSRPTLWRDGQMIDVGGEPLDAAGGASDINHFDEVVAHLEGVGPFRWFNGERTELPSLGQCSSSAFAINSGGLIAGESNPDPRCANGQEHAVVWEPRGVDFVLFNLNDWIPRHPGLRLASSKDLNDAGQMAVFGEYDDGRERGFLVTPYLFEMSDPVPGRAGTMNTITVAGLQPNQRVLLAYGTHEGAQKIRPSCPGGTLIIRDPRALPAVRADANGVATITLNVPLAARGRTVRLQAVAPIECEISHTLTWTFE